MNGKFRDNAMTEDEFDAYVSQIIFAAGADDAETRVGFLLQEFQEKSYLSGKYMLIDILRSELAKHDLRPSKEQKSP